MLNCQNIHRICKKITHVISDKMNLIFHHILLRYLLKIDETLQIYVNPHSTPFWNTSFLPQSARKNYIQDVLFLSFPKYAFTFFQHMFEYIEVGWKAKQNKTIFQNTSIFATLKGIFL